MKLLLDPKGSAIDIAAAPLSVEQIKVTPGAKKIDLVTNPRTDGAVPFGRSATDVMVMEISVRVDEQATLDEGLAELRKLSQLLDEIENQLPAGVPLEETPDNSAKASTAYVLLGEVRELPREKSGDQLGWYHRAPFAVIVLTCEPFYEGPEEEAGSAEGSNPLVDQTIDVVKGDVDARGLAIIEDRAGALKRYGEIGIESRYFDAEDPAPLLIKAGGAAGEKLEGLQGKEVAGEGTHSAKMIQATLTKQPVAICSTGIQPHIGQWRESLRFQASSLDVYVRLAYRIGSGPWGRGPWVRAPIAAEWVEQFLTTINVPEAALGGQAWEGRIEAYSASDAGGDVLKIDYVENMPAQRWLMVRAPLSVTPPEVTDGVDDLMGAGALNGSAADSGGNWEGGGDPAGFTRTSEGAVRSTVSDADISLGRYEVLPLIFSSLAVQMELRFSNQVNTVGMGFRLRFSEKGWLHIFFIPQAGFGSTGNHRIMVIESPGVSIGDFQFNGPLLREDVFGLFTVFIFTDGTYVMRIGGQQVVGHGIDLGSGGALKEGKVGIYDADWAADPCTRTYRNFSAWVPEQSEICASNQELRIDDEMAERYDATGTYVSPVPEHRGGGLILPVSGDRDRSVRVVSKLRKGDIETEFSDLSGSKHKTTMAYVPRYRFPRS